MIRHITPAAASASSKACELLNSGRALRIIDRHGDRHRWRFKGADLIAFAGGWFDAEPMDFRSCKEDRECVEIRTDASVAEILARVAASAKNGKPHPVVGNSQISKTPSGRGQNGNLENIIRLSTSRGSEKPHPVVAGWGI